MPSIQIGQLLIQRGVLTPLQINHILDVQQVSPRPFGDLAERMFGISAQDIEDAWVDQYIRTAGITDLSQHTVEVEALRVLNRRQAWQFHILPISGGSSSRSTETPELTAATSREDLVRAVNFAARKLNDPVYFLIAEREQLREFLMKHYPVPHHIAQYAENL